jgi:oxaloacetate decarboxylase alpha subunit
VIRYALGHFGGEVEELMDPNVRDRILDRPRARELAAIVRPVLSLQEIRRDLDAEGVSDEELLLRSLVRKEDIEATRAAGPAKEYITDSDPVVSLVEQLSRLADTDTIQVSRPGFRVTLRKNASAQ